MWQKVCLPRYGAPWVHIRHEEGCTVPVRDRGTKWVPILLVSKTIFIGQCSKRDKERWREVVAAAPSAP